MKKELIKSNRFYKLNVCFVGNREYIDTALEIVLIYRLLHKKAKRRTQQKKYLSIIKINQYFSYRLSSILRLVT